MPVRLTGDQLDVLHGAGLARAGAEPRPQQVGQDILRTPFAVGDVQGDFDEVARIENVIGDEQRLPFRQLGVAVAVEHEDWPPAGLDDLEPDGLLKWAALREKVSGEPVVNQLFHHGVEGFAHIGGNLERWDEPAAFYAEPADGCAAQSAGPGR